MKKLLSLITFLIIAGCTSAQDAKIAHIPAYRILTTDSVFATPADLKKNKPVMIIYFSPDCSHCQRMMFELKPKMKELVNIQVVMITFSHDYDIRGIKEFKNNFSLSNYPNFTIGTEGYTGFVQRYYNVKTTPYIAIYNKKGVLTKYFDKVPEADDVVKAVKANGV